ATIHLRNQDETVGVDNETNNRFERLFHHRDYRYVPRRLSREQLHAPKVMNKTDTNTNRSSNLRNTLSIPDYSETLTSKLQNPRTQSKSKEQELSVISNQETKSPSIHSGSHSESDHIIMYCIKFNFEYFLCFFFFIDQILDQQLAERIRPWVHSPAMDEIETTSQTSIKPSSTNLNDPNLYQIHLTASDFSGTYQKSPEYTGEYATITKSEEQLSRPNIPDLFNKQSTNSSEQQKNNTNAATDPNITRL
ncbi:unnamed protein product, partial [Rotaria sp. Silwood1]